MISSSPWTALCSFALISCLSTEPAVSKVKNDFDGDGVAEKVVIDNAKFDETGLLESKRVAINLSKTAKTVMGTVETGTGSLTAYQGASTSDLVVDFTNRTSRDAAELSYLIYGWNNQRQNFCLKVSVDGVPPNKLHDELVPTQVEVTRYGQCQTLDSGFSRQPLSRDESSALALSELSSLKNDEQIPEYLAFELANFVDATNVTTINDAGYYQEQYNFLTSALIILRSVHSRFPRRVVSTLNLADTYWKLGKSETACSLYKEYLRSVDSRSKLPERVEKRASCQ